MPLVLSQPYAERFDDFVRWLAALVFPRRCLWAVEFFMGAFTTAFVVAGWSKWSGSTSCCANAGAASETREIVKSKQVPLRKFIFRSCEVGSLTRARWVPVFFRFG